MSKKTKQKKDLRIFVNTNAIWSNSGYGNQARLMSEMWKEKGWTNIGMLDFFGLEGGVLEMNGIRHYPKMNLPYGDDILIPHAQNFKADITMTFQDIWVLNTDVLKQTKNWIPYVPIDHDPVTPSIIERLKLAYRIITYSKFGQAQLRKQGIHSTYIPHCVDTDVFTPMGKNELRKKFGMPQDKFIWGMVGANKDNPPRKGFQEAIDAFFEFQKEVPDSIMFVHTLPQQQGGFPIVDYAKFLGINEKIYFFPTYMQMFGLGSKEIAELMNTFDCLLSPSQSEGFCIPIIEAQACGVPVIVNNFTAMPELVIDGETGYICDIASKRFSPLLSYIGVASVPSLLEKMKLMYKADRIKMGEKAREHAVQNYSTKVVAPQWDVFFEKVQKELLGI